MSTEAVNTVAATAPRRWFWQQLKAGMRYALWFLLVGFCMGGLYGLFAGLFYEPALFAVSLIGIFCVLNFVVALPVAIVNSVLAAFKKHSKPAYRYFALSLGFVVVYLSYFYVLHLFKIEVF